MRRLAVLVLAGVLLLVPATLDAKKPPPLPLPPAPGEPPIPPPSGPRPPPPPEIPMPDPCR